MSSQQNGGENNEDNIFLSEKVSTGINIISYFLLILITIFIGRGLLAKKISEQRLTSLKWWATTALALIWVFFLISNSIKLAILF